MPNLHMTDSGPMPCAADPGECPLKDSSGKRLEHFDNWNVANEAYVKKLEEELSHTNHDTIKKDSHHRA